MTTNKLAALAACLALPALAAGQESAPQPDLGTIEEIIVTAQKRSEVLEDVPISITNVSGEQLENGGLASVNDLPQLVPALRVDLAGGFSQPTIRGIGSSIAGAGFTSNVATYVDGFYAPSQLTTDMQLLNLASVQVLKGPQGTLFGRNATGGAILLTTLEPSHETDVRLRASYARFNRSSVGGYVSSGLSETLAANVTVGWERGDGFLRNIVTGAEEDGDFDTVDVRTSWLWEPAEGTSLKLTYAHSDREDARPAATSSFQGLSAGTPFGAVVATERREVSNTSPTGFQTNTDGVFLTARHDFGAFELVSYSMWRDENSRTDLDLEGSSFPIFDVFFDIENTTYSQEIDLSGEVGDRVDWIAGFFYMNFDEHYSDFEASVGGGPFTTLYDVGTQISAYALFGDLTWQFAERWYISGGLRYSEESPDAFFDVRPAGVAFGLAPAPGETNFDHSFDEFTPRVVLRFEPTDASSLYASYSRGFKAGLLAPSSFSTTPVDSETINAYEVGYKQASDRIRWSLSAFYYDYENLQLASYNGVQAIVTNAANATVWGFEAQASAALMEGLETNVGLSYTHGEYDDFPGAPVFIQDLSLPPGPTFGLFPPTTTDASGFDIQRSPKFTGTFGVTYERELPYGALHLNTNYFYTSGFYFDPAKQFRQDGYGLLNLRIGWTDPSGRFTLSGFATNVTDEKYRAQVLPGQFAIQQTWGEPASYGLMIEFDY
jgi:iron complex outermembrane receptor protein